MKKTISGLLVVILLCSLVVTLFACDADELKRLSYIDQYGNEVRINIEKTSDVDQVSSSILALGEKPIDRSNLTSLLFTLTGDAGMTGTQHDIPFEFSLSGTSEFGINLEREASTTTFMQFLKDLDLYYYTNVTGTVPKNLLFPIEDEEGENDNGKINFLNLKECNFTSTMFFNNFVFYAKANLSDMLSGKVKEYYSGINKIKDNYGYLAFGTFTQILEGLIDMDKGTEILKEVRSSDSYINTSIKILQIEEKLEKVEGDEANASIKARLYPQVKECVKAFNVQIINTKGSKFTLSFHLTKAGVEYLATLIPKTASYLEGYDGDTYFELTMDAKNMIDAELHYDITDVLTFLSKKLDTDNTVIIKSAYASGVATLSSNVNIPKIANEDIANAKEINMLELLGLIPVVYKYAF